jgi:AcrR family transcriptional regulator
VTSKSTTRPLPGQQPLPREFITRHQRVRIVNALALEIYENFRSKEDCFLAAQEFAMSTALERVVDAAGELDDWPRRVCAGLAAFLDYVVEEPALARTCMVEALAAGPAAVRYYEESQQAFVSLFKLGRDVSPHGARLPETLEEAIIGGVFWIVYQRLAVAEMQAIGELLPEIIEFALTPYLGAERAREVAATETGDPRSAAAS